MSDSADAFMPAPSPECVQRRRHGRVRVGDVATTLGTLSDLSASGMCVLCGAVPPAMGKLMHVAIRGVDRAFMVPARVVRVRRRGLMSHEVGLEFTELTGEIREELLQIARQAVCGTTLVEMRRAA